MTSPGILIVVVVIGAIVLVALFIGLLWRDYPGLPSSNISFGRKHDDLPTSPGAPTAGATTVHNPDVSGIATAGTTIVHDPDGVESHSGSTNDTDLGEDDTPIQIPPPAPSAFPVFRFTVTKGGNEGVTYDFDRARMTIGRNYVDDLQLVDDISVSRTHIVITRSDEKLLIRNMRGRQNQIIVDNEIVCDDAVLTGATTIRLGNSQITVERI